MEIKNNHQNFVAFKNAENFSLVKISMKEFN